MKFHDAMSYLGAGLSLLGAITLLWSNYLKNGYADAQSKVADTKQKEQTGQINQLQTTLDKERMDAAERNRIQVQRFEQMIDIQVAAENLKNEYQRRLRIISEVPQEASNPSVSGNGNKELEADLDKKLESLFATAPEEITRLLQQKRETQAEENQARQTAISLSGQYQQIYATLVESMEMAVNRGDASGHIKVVRRNPTTKLPNQLFYSGAEIAGAPQTNPVVSEFIIAPESVVQICLQYGLVRSPAALGGTVVSNTTGIIYPELLIRAHTGNGKNIIAANLRFQPSTKDYFGTGDGDPAWEELNKEHSKDGGLIAANLMAIALKKLRVSAAITGNL